MNQERELKHQPSRVRDREGMAKLWCSKQDDTYVRYKGEAVELLFNEGTNLLMCKGSKVVK